MDAPCPACGGVLEPARRHGAATAACPECRGVWFEQGRVGPYVERMVADQTDLPHARLRPLGGGNVAEEDISEPGRWCPRCRAPMTKYNYAYDSNIILDRCPVCKGIWADAGELRRLAVYTKGHPKMDRLAASMAEHVQKRADFEETLEAVRDLGRVPALWFFAPRVILPLGDDQPVRSLPGITLGLVLCNVLVFGLTQVYVLDMATFFQTFGLVSANIAAGQDLLTLLTHMFLHAGPLHLIGNLLFLWIFGDNVEDDLGHLGFPLFFVACGLGAALLHTAVYPAGQIPCIGASGAVSGVIAAYFVLHPTARLRTFIFYTVVNVPAFVYIGGWIGMNLIQALVTAAAGVHSGVAWFAHLGGFATGLAIALVFRNFARDSRDA